MTAAPETLLVIGPLTRAGRSLVASHDGPVLLGSRSDADARALADLGHDAERVVDLTSGELEARLPADGRLSVAVCALGPIHPDRIDMERDTVAYERDLGVLRDVYAATKTLRVVLVSTVIALAPGDDRRYYGGWKALVEQQLVALTATHVDARLSVLYPGRIAEGAGRLGSAALLHTTYHRLAAVIGGELAGQGRRRVLGLDARLWIAARALGVLVGALRPRPVRPPHELTSKG